MVEQASESEWSLLEPRFSALEDSYCQNNGQYQLVSQYLSLSPASFSSPQQERFESEKAEESSGSKQEEPTAPCCPSRARPAPKRPSSTHNFQKHLSTTLKRCVRIKKSCNSNHSRSSIANELWEYFVSAPQSCKRSICCLLLGGTSKWGGNQKYEEEYCSLLAQFSEYSEEEVNSAQAYLRKEVLRQSPLLLQSHSFQNRRINNAELFQEYLRAFIQELQDCRVSLRLPKHHPPAPHAPSPPPAS